MPPVRTDSRPLKVEGIVFAEWKVGIFTREWRSEDGRALVRRMGHGYVACVDGGVVASGLFTRYEALRAAARAMQNGS